MPSLSSSFTKQKLCLDLAALKHACPHHVWVAPRPDEPLVWSGVVFVQRGPYANAILRFQIDFPEDYPECLPIVTFLSDVFHPLVTPLTTYTYSTQDTGAETSSAADRYRLPPGGLNLRHGFPEWFQSAPAAVDRKNAITSEVDNARDNAVYQQPRASTSIVIEVLQYLRIVLDTDAVLDSVPIESAANPGAWHAWRSYRSKAIGGRSSPAPNASSNPSDASQARSSSPRQQPGGARRPAEWNWQGVWEDRVKKSIRASISDHALYGGDSSDVIRFSKIEPDTVNDMLTLDA